MVNFFHGGSVWSHFDAKILPPKKNKCEAGIGIYLTTHYLTAKKYGRSVSIISVIDQPVLSHNVLIPIDEYIKFVKLYIGPKNRDTLLEYTNKEFIQANHIVNLFVNLDITGKQGLAMNDFIRTFKVDASIHNCSNNEQWLVVHNPKIIIKTQHIRSKDINCFEFPIVFK